MFILLEPKEKDAMELTSFLDRLTRRFNPKQLMILTGLLFVADLFVPDPIPFIDELILGLLTYLFGMWAAQRKNENQPKPPRPEKNVTPPT